MAKISAIIKNKKKSGGVKLIEKLQKKLLVGRNKSTSTYVPKDVKEGHFAVIAESDKEEESKRFVLPLSFLTNPIFVRLLEQAAEEYGFDHEGALTIPCKPSELHKILQHKYGSKKREVLHLGITITPWFFRTVDKY